MMNKLRLILGIFIPYPVKTNDRVEIKMAKA